MGRDMFAVKAELIYQLEEFLADYKNLLCAIDDIKVSSDFLDEAVRSFKIKDITSDTKTKKVIKSMVSLISDLSISVDDIISKINQVGAGTCRANLDEDEGEDEPKPIPKKRGRKDK